MFNRTCDRNLFAGMLAALLLSVAAPVMASETLNALKEAVAIENWSLAIELVDRLTEEQGSSGELVIYRSRLVQLHTQTELEELAADLDTNQPEIVVTPDPQLSLERELERQAILDAREARLTARAARREQRNIERQQRSEQNYLRALERESLARTNAINARRSRTVLCDGYYCGTYRSSPFDRHRTRYWSSPHSFHSVETNPAVSDW